MNRAGDPIPAGEALGGTNDQTAGRKDLSGRPGHLFTFRSGGWVLAIAVLLCLILVADWARRLPQSSAVVGDGRTVASYGYDLSTCLVPRELLVAAGMPKDGLPALVDPAVFTPVQADAYGVELRKGHQGKFLVPSDRVIGVERNGEARAYPIKLVTWHEVVNDTVGDRPILVTYNPLCDSSVVFDRRVGGETLEFGVSGLVYNSNLVLYDRRGQADPNGASADHGPNRLPNEHVESLWSQLEFRAIAGPAAQRGAALTLVPTVTTTWAEWLREHPQTTVLAPVRERLRVYKRTYEPYFGSDKLRFPVAPLAPVNGVQLKSPVLAAQVDGRWQAVPLAKIREHANAQGVWQTQIAGQPVTYHCADAHTAWVRFADGGLPPQVSCFWFAWYAMHPPE